MIELDCELLQCHTHVIMHECTHTHTRTHACARTQTPAIRLVLREGGRVVIFPHQDINMIMIVEEV